MARKAKPKTATKTQRNPRTFEGASVTTAEITSSKYRKSDAAALVARFVGTTAFCASFNARNLASCNFTLYRKARKKSDGRGLTRREKEWVSKIGPSGPGVKSSSRAKMSDDIQVVEEHPVLDLIRDPNPRDTGFEYWESHHNYKEVTGGAYCLVIEGSKRVSLEQLPAQDTRIVASKDGIVGGYIYGRERTIEVAFTAEEVVYEKFAKSMFNPYYGAGPLHQIIMPHDIRTAMNEWNLAVFDKMARPDVALIFKAALSKDQKQQAREEIKRRFQGQQNIGEWLILSGGEADVKPLGWTPKDLDYIAGSKNVDTEICTAFGVPETFLRPNDGALSQAKSMMEWYARNTLLPRGVKHSEWLTERILPLFDEDMSEYWFAIDNPVPQDEALQATRTSVLVGAGIMTINEARYEVGLDSSKEEGASILRVSGVPLDKVGAAPQFGGFNDPNGNGSSSGGAANGNSDPASGADGGDTSGNNDDAADGGKSGSGNDGKGICCGDALPGINVGNAGVVPSEPKPVKVVSQRDLWSKASPSPLYRASIDPMEDACRKFFKQQMKATLAEMEAKPSGYQKHGRMTVAHKTASPEAMAEARRLLVTWGVTDEKWVTLLADRLVPLSEERMVDSAVRAIRYVQDFTDVLDDAKPENFTLQNPRAASWAASNTSDLLKACDGINKTTADALASTLADGILEGESIGELKKRVKAAYEAEMPGGESMSDYRSNMIARTETARAQVNGTLAGWEATGVVEGKQWLASPDLCEFCQAASEQYGKANVPLSVSLYSQGGSLTGSEGGVMNFDFASVDGPPLHPHCKCSMIPVIKGFGPAVKP